MARADGERNGHERSQPALRGPHVRQPTGLWPGYLVRGGPAFEPPTATSKAGQRAASAATSWLCGTGDPLSTGPCGGGCLLGALALEDQLVVLGGAERGHAGSEDLHEPPAVPRMLVDDVLVAVPGFDADAEEGRAPVFAKPNKLVLIGRVHRMPFSSLIPGLMIDHHR